MELGAGVRVVRGDRTGYAFTEELTLPSLKLAARTAAAIAEGPAKTVPQRFHVADRMPSRYATAKPWEDVRPEQKLPNLDWQLGTRAQAELLKDVKDGIFVTGFLGGNSNSTTGDYSLGVRGFRVHGGEVQEPVGEMNVSGNLGELWANLVAVGNDPYPYSSQRTPTLVFEGVQFAGL